MEEAKKGKMMNFDIADEQFERIMKQTIFIDGSIAKDMNIKKRIKKLFREAYASGFSDGIYSAQDNIDALLNKLQPNYNGLLQPDGKDIKI